MSDVLERLGAALAGRYTIVRELGRGGMATVFLARDLRHKRMVAIKLLRPDLAIAIGPERFLREIQIAAGLSHPNILSIFDSGEVDGVLYYVMPYIEGETLRHRLLRESQLPVGEAVRIVREIAEGLGHAHRRGLVHRDIKPAVSRRQLGAALLVGLRQSGQCEVLAEPGSRHAIPDVR